MLTTDPIAAMTKQAMSAIESCKQIYWEVPSKNELSTPFKK